MASSSIGESIGIPVVGIQNTYCECDTRARIIISESERNPNRLYATCAKYPKCNYYVWLTPQRVGDREPGNQDTNNSEQFPIDNVDFAMFEARVAKIESMLGWIKMQIPKAALNVHKQLRLSSGGTFHSFKPDVKPIHDSVYASIRLFIPCTVVSIPAKSDEDPSIRAFRAAKSEAQRRIHLVHHPTLSLLLWLSEQLQPFLFEYVPSFEPLSSILHTNGRDKNEVGKVKWILSVDAVHDKFLRGTSI
ncbi:sister chromatid cohesion protein PDS5-like protein [Senna tora]|uniref:Sister chromatid cohesion protein PDS5-like protein n=1 Tax=Senna tora TaxID=362788 RepID=A0A834TGP1_9FABA|nr:sister chromatid cohesion protein PDS5-like protein [Senna tora]